MMNTSQSPAELSAPASDSLQLDTSDILAFGDCVLSPAHRRLVRHGAKVEIGDRAFDLLLSLVESRGTTVSKDQLMAKVWPGRIVEENTLEGQMSILRRALGDDRAAIRTIAGRGYQFIGEIGAVAPHAEVVLADHQPASFKSPMSAARVSLPASISPIIGREVALSEITELMLTCR